MATAQDYKNAWGKEKYGKEGVYTFEAETRSDGYCETCYSEYAVVAVYCNLKEVGELRDVSIDQLINEVIEFAARSTPLPNEER